MKFAELKQSLTQDPKNSYYIFGEDGFLRDSAQKLIEKRMVTQIPELNISVFNDENFDLEKVLLSFQSLPFGDEKRVVVLSDAGFDSKSKEEILKFLKTKNPNVCIVFKDSQNTPSEKEIAKLCTTVDCTELDEKTLFSLITFRLKKHGLSIDTLALKTLVDYCNKNMTFVDQELKKLCAYGGEQGVITQKIVETLVHKNLEFAVFQLSNSLVEKNAKKTYEILDFLLSTKEEPSKLFGMLTNVFRRIFYTSITKASNAQIAEMLGVKEYSIKVAHQTAINFSPKKLKKILDLAGKLDFDLKSGRIAESNSLTVFVANCLLI